MRGEWGAVMSRTIDLGYEQLLLLEGRRGTRVKVIYGGIWLTEEGLPQDVFAGSGDEVALRSRRLAVIEGLGATRLEVVEPVPRQGWQALAQRIGSAARRVVRRARSFVNARAWSPRAPRGTLALLAAVVGVALPVLVWAGITAAAPLLGQYL